MSGKNYGIYKLEVFKEIVGNWHYKISIKQEGGGYNTIWSTAHSMGFPTESAAKKNGLNWLKGWIESDLKEVLEALNNV
jgi:hypothetical protein